MIRLGSLAVLVLTATSASAQVAIRAPFVRVEVGGPNVYVRLPFFQLQVGGPPPGVLLPGPVIVGPPVVVPPAVARPAFPPLEAEPPAQVLPEPKQKIPNDLDNGPPAAQPAQAPTLEQFGKSFQAKPGHYEIALINPITRQPTTVRFSLPEGSPRRVIVRRSSIEFDYGPRSYVRIEFDRDGAEVISR